jgi:transposase-like protein
MTQPNDSRFTELVHCPSCTHNVPAQIVVNKKRVRVVPGQKCPRCHSALDAAVVLPQLEAA